MLVELVVENYAVIERVRVRFRPGFNVLTGETGGGKSLVVDALDLLYGGRASADMVRSGAGRARVSGVFEPPEAAGFRRLLEQSGIGLEDGELLVEREVQSGGKSRAFLGSRPVAASLLKDLAVWLGDIHGQHDQQRLFSPAGQLEILDYAAGVAGLRDEVGAAFSRWRACVRELEELDRDQQDKLRLSDLWGFQLREIEAARLQPREDEALESERNILRNLARLREAAAAAYDSLYDSPAAALSAMRQARRRLEEICRIDPGLREVNESLVPAEVAIEEAARAVRAYLGALEADPARLEEMESRLALLDKLKRKYGATLEAVIAYAEEVRQKLLRLEHGQERRAGLEKQRGALAAAYDEAAGRLSSARRETALRLEKQIQAELASLAMGGARFRAQFETTAWSEDGIDRVCFLLAPNAGEELKPLDRIASGGELSRVALALKTCAAAKAGSGRGLRGAARTLVFDEVDAGIGGATAEAVGRRLKKLAAAHQVICVTHLAQIAGFADHHLFVEKREVKGRTFAAIEELEGDARTREIGRMLSGQKMTPEALRHAEQLLKMAAD